MIACARHIQGRALLRQGAVEQGLCLLDEAMVAVVTGELSSLMTGLVYCSVIDTCMQVCALSRAREWTSALTRWCDAQPQLVAFTGTCLVHRAEIMELQGDWPDALEQAQRACSADTSKIKQQPPAAAFYRLGELYRLKGEFARAEKAYRDTYRRGCDPHPGLALLRMMQGQTEVAATMIRRALSSTQDRLARSRLLPAFIEIVLATGDIKDVSNACRELEEIAHSFDTDVLGAIAAYARGSVLLREGNPMMALFALRRAFESWQKLETPYPAARARVLVGLASRALGDIEAAELDWEAAKATFQQLGAGPDLDRMEPRANVSAASPYHGLTKRELQVLQLVSAGETNKMIAAHLFVSQRTIDRHVSNLFCKLDVRTRTAATTYAHVHKLV